MTPKKLYDNPKPVGAGVRSAVSKKTLVDSDVITLKYSKLRLFG